MCATIHQGNGGGMDDIERRISEKYFRNGEGFLQIYPGDQDDEIYGSLLRKGREICASMGCRVRLVRIRS